MSYYIITWRPAGGDAYFFRGDRRHGLFLPFISEEKINEGDHVGWTPNIDYARVFEVYPVFERATCAKRLDVSRLKIFPFEGPLLQTHIFRPLKRQQRY
jgi:hypothetical protein